MEKDIEIAKRYFELANKSNLIEIEKLFTDASTYISENTGVFLGVDNIMGMMKQFFDNFKILNWEISTVKELSDGIVLFDFVFEGEKYDGTKVSTSGYEYIIVYNNKIQSIYIKNK